MKCPRIRYVVFFLALCLPGTAADSPQALLAAGRVDDALRTIQQQLDHAPTSAEAQNLLCRAYFQIENWDRAIAACEKATSLDPKSSVYHLWLGSAYGEKAGHVGPFSAMGLAKKVRTEFERAVECDPRSVEARIALAEFYVDAPGIVGGGKDKARAQADALVLLNPGESHWVNGRIAEKNKDAAEAEREYRATIATNHGGARAWLHLAQFYAHTKRYDEMEKAVRTLESEPVDRPESLMDAASLLYRANRDYPLATRLLKRYLASPTVEEAPSFKAHHLLGELLEKQGDRPGAAEQYRAALALAHDFSKAQESLKRVER